LETLDRTKNQLEKMEGWSVPVTPLKIEATLLTVTTPVSTSKPKYSLSSDSEDDPFAASDDSNEYIPETDSSRSSVGDMSNKSVLPCRRNLFEMGM
jgi:hypothetical protein